MSALRDVSLLKVAGLDPLDSSDEIRLLPSILNVVCDTSGCLLRSETKVVSEVHVDPHVVRTKASGLRSVLDVQRVQESLNALLR
jgi:hypothetical protein